MKRCALFLGVAGILAGPLAAQSSKDEVQSSPRVKVLKIWASDEPAKAEAKGEARPEGKADAKGEAPKDELKEYRKRLEEQTRKRRFELEGKPEVRSAEPGKSLVFPLIDDLKLQILPILKGKGKDEKLRLLLTLLQKDMEKRKFELSGTLPLIYCTPIRRGERNLVVIVQMIERTEKKEKEKAETPATK
jgi:hypothetical protein